VNGRGLKQPRLRLDARSYGQLRKQVLERDGWRCQLCGSMKSLQVHHKRLRSHSGSDIEDNLITLCDRCHRLTHSATVSLRWLRILGERIPFNGALGDAGAWIL